MRRKLWLLFAAATPLLLFAASALAGNNEGVIVRLSWARYAHVQDLSTLESTEVPIYLTIEGAADVQAMAIDFRWTPHTIVGPCYDLVPNDEDMSACGQTLLTAPDSLFEGASYDWTIAFASGADRSCVAFKIRGERCDKLPATFCAVSVKLMDSEGQVDVVQEVASATLFGGNGGCPSELESIYPPMLLSNHATTLTVAGEGVADATWLELHGGGQTIVAEQVTVTGQDAIQAVVTIPQGLARPIHEVDAEVTDAS